MLSKLRARLTYANVMATVAVFVALGGSSYAAIKVTGKNVTDSSLTGKDIKNNSVTDKDVKGIKTGDVRDRSLLAKDFKAGQLPRGPEGPPNPNAETIDGIDSSALVQGGGTAYFDRAELARGANRILFEIAGIATVNVSCSAGGSAQTSFDFEDSATYRGVYQPDETADAFDWEATPGNSFDLTTGDNTYAHIMGGTGSAPSARRGLEASVIQTASTSAATPCRFQTHAVARSR